MIAAEKVPYVSIEPSKQTDSLRVMLWVGVPKQSVIKHSQIHIYETSQASKKDSRH